MIIDCERCVMRDLACDDCVVSALLGAPEGGITCTDDAVSDSGRGIDLTVEERNALDVLAAAGMTRRLRLLPGVSGKAAGGGTECRTNGRSRRVG